MDIALNTNFLRSAGSPRPYLKVIAEAGFTHLHWGHQWCTDFLYSRSELAQYRSWLQKYKLLLLDIHGSKGQEKCWYSPVEYEREAGVELVINRIVMLHELGGAGSLIMHIPAFRTGDTPEKKTLAEKQLTALKRSLDELIPVLEKYGVRIAVENGFSDTFEIIARLMKEYPEQYLGITYDSGHGNIAEARGLELLEPLKNRLQALHLNDNDTSGDLHQPPYLGTVDWERMARLIASSSYTGRPMSFELTMRNTPFYKPALEADQKPGNVKAFPVRLQLQLQGEQDQKPGNVKAFLADAYDRCVKVAKLVEKYRQSQCQPPTQPQGA